MFRKSLHFVVTAMNYIAAALVGVIVVVNILGVVMRYYYNRPIIWCEEVSLILFVWFVFCALVPVVYRRAGIGLDFFVDLMPGLMRRVVQILVEVMGAALFAVTCAYCLDLMRRSAFRFSPILLIPFWYVYLATVVGMGLSAFILLVHACDDIRALARERGTAQK